MHKFLLIISLLGILYLTPQKTTAQPAIFDVEYIGFSAEAEAAFTYATDIWSNFLISDVPIQIVAHLQPLLPSQLGITFPNGEINFEGAPFDNHWYASCLANSISGIDLNGDNADIEIYLSSTANWYFGLDENPGAGEYDFVSTVLHEICHGLGFLSLANVSDDSGSFGLIYASSFFPLTTTFIWPALDTLPGIFDKYLNDISGIQLTTFPNPSEILGNYMTNNDMYFSSPELLIETDGIRPKIYAPETFVLGSSLSHWDEATYPVGSYNEFMTPKAAPATADHMPGILTLTVLEDLGWQINYDTFQVNIEQFEKTVQIFPNPATEKIVIKNANLWGDTYFELINLQGISCLHEKLIQQAINIQTVETGIYILILKNENQEIILKEIVEIIK